MLYHEMQCAMLQSAANSVFPHSHESINVVCALYHAMLAIVCKSVVLRLDVIFHVAIEESLSMRFRCPTRSGRFLLSLAFGVASIWKFEAVS